VVWLIAAGLHPRATATTQRVADDLADRMDYDTGHVRYCLDEMAARLGMSRASVKRHVGYLRELGALAWVQHGTRTNIRAAMGLKGYAATATIYAAVIPAVYDHAMGHRIVGSGYEARIVIDYRSTPKPVDNPPVENPDRSGLEPPSLTLVKEEGKLKMVGGSNYISQARRDGESPTQPTSNSGSRPAGLKGTTGRSPLQAAQDILIAAKVRPLVTWTQREKLRPLAVAIRPLIDEGLDWYTIAVRLNNMGPGEKWRPRRPAAYITVVLADQTRRAARQTEAAEQYELENPTPGAFQGSFSTRLDLMALNQQGIARYQDAMRTRGHEDLSGGATAVWNAEADILAFLNGSPS